MELNNQVNVLVIQESKQRIKVIDFAKSVLEEFPQFSITECKLN